jgi:hypothetical protein
MPLTTLDRKTTLMPGETGLTRDVLERLGTRSA